MKSKRLLVSLLAAMPLVPACSSMPSLVMTPTVKPSSSVNHSRERPETYYQLGRHMQAQNRLVEAADAYQKALALDAAYYEAANGLATVYATQGQYDRAIEHLRAALVQSPLSAHLHNNLGYVYLLKGDLAEAIRMFESAAALEPRNQRALNNLASAYAKAGQTEKAEQARAQLVGAANARQASAHPIATPSAALHSAASAGNREGGAQRARTSGELVTRTAPGDAVLRQINPNVYELVTTTTAVPKAAFTAIASAPAVVKVSVPDFPARPEARALAAPPAASIPLVREFRVEVSNGNGVPGMARRIGTQLKGVGIDVVRLTDQIPYRQMLTQVQYRDGYAAEARRVVSLLHTPVKMIETAGLHADIDVRLVLGKDVQSAAVLVAPKPSAPHIVAQR